MSGLSYTLTRVWSDDPWLADDLGLDPEGDRTLYTVDDAEMAAPRSRLGCARRPTSRRTISTGPRAAG